MKDDEKTDKKERMMILIRIFLQIDGILGRGAARVAEIYQKTLSPDHGIFKIWYPLGYCRFKPTCSEYGRQAFEKYGFLKGAWIAGKRILRCNPFNKGGWDPLK